MNLKPEEIPGALRDLEAFVLANKGLTAIEHAYAQVPEVKLIEQAQYLKEHMLPRIAEKRGVENDDYKFYYGLVESLMDGIKKTNAAARESLDKANDKIYIKYLLYRLNTVEEMLLEHTTMEKILARESARELINIHLKGIQK